MILRVPDYFGEFECTAGWCKDSCCIGWEINIDEDTYDFYSCAEGEIGQRLQAAMYKNEDGEISFRLGKKKRCPFLNGENLCDICIHMGEEALSEVCTEYPRFSLWYADVQQKCLSLSCEEVGRILFSKEEPVEFTEVELPGDSVFAESDHLNRESDHLNRESDHLNRESDHLNRESDHLNRESNHLNRESDHLNRESDHLNRENYYLHDESDHLAEDDYLYGENRWEKTEFMVETPDLKSDGFSEELKYFLEQAQNEAIAILQNRSISIEERMKQYLSYLTWVQEKINRTNVDAGESLAYTDEELAEDIPVMDFELLKQGFEQYEKRMDIFRELEVLDHEWEDVELKMQEKLAPNTYHEYLNSFMGSCAYLETDYENLLVYFTFRYFMNSYYNMDVLSYGKLAVVFTLMVRDIDMLRFEENGGAFSRADRMDTARIFSKEVEHSEENVEYVREELMFL